MKSKAVSLQEVIQGNARIAERERIEGSQEGVRSTKLRDGDVPLNLQKKTDQ